MNRVLVTGGTGGAGSRPRQLGKLIPFLAAPDSAPVTGAAIPIG